MSNGSINIDNIGNVQSFFGMNLDQILQKMKDAGIGTGGGSSGGSGTGGGSEPGSGNSTITLDFPDKSELTVGNTVAFANKDWIVAHVTDTEAYLALSTVASNTPIAWAQLQQACIDWANEFLKAENRAYLKSVLVETTCGIVFAASEEQLNGGFSYFNSNSKRKVGTAYWSSSGSTGFYAYWVDEDGVLDNGSYGSDESHEECFRPFICIDLTLYNT